MPIEWPGEEQAICAVGLVKPRPDVFAAAIQRLLVVCTTTEVQFCRSKKQLWICHVMLSQEMRRFIPHKYRIYACMLPAAESMVSIDVDCKWQGTEAELHSNNSEAPHRSLGEAKFPTSRAMNPKEDRRPECKGSESLKKGLLTEEEFGDADCVVGCVLECWQQLRLPE